MISLSPEKSLPRPTIPVLEPADPHIAWLPGDALEQVGEVAFQCTDELDDGIHARDPQAALQLTYLGAM